MGDINKKSLKIFVIEEATEGTYDPATLGSESVQPLVDGFEINVAKESLERNVLNGSIGMVRPRTGMSSATATIPVEFRASSTAGGAPDYDLLLKSCLGEATDVAANTSTTGNTNDTINFADTSDYEVGQPVLVKEAGAYHLSPIESIITNTSITLAIAAGSAFSDGVEVEAARVYSPANSGHPSLSVEAWYEGTRKEYIHGAKVSSMALNNFNTGQLADLSFSLEGANGSVDTSGSLGVNPDFEDSLPCVILSSCVYQDNQAVLVNDFSFSVENTLGWKTSTCSESGRINSIVTSRKVTGSFSPYKDSASQTDFDNFDNSSAVSLFVTAYNPSGVTGEFGEIICIHLPNVVFSELSTGDQDGLVNQSITFTANRGNAGDEDEIFISSI